MIVFMIIILLIMIILVIMIILIIIIIIIMIIIMIIIIITRTISDLQLGGRGARRRPRDAGPQPGAADLSGARKGGV